MVRGSLSSQDKLGLQNNTSCHGSYALEDVLSFLEVLYVAQQSEGLWSIKLSSNCSADEETLKNAYIYTTMLII